MAVDLEAIHRAAAAQLSEHLDRETNVVAFPTGSVIPPQITVHSDTAGYLAYFGTMGPDGEADLMLRLKIEVEAVDVESVCLKMCAYLGIVTGNGSSVPDAIHVDRTLGGTVADCVALTAEWDSDGDPRTAWVPLRIILHKQNAEV
jgi:hypothetical protein